MPSDYQLTAALRVARLLDEACNAASDLRSSYRSAVTQGEHADAALVDGEELLAVVGLVVTADDLARPQTALHTLARLDDATAIELLRSLFRQRSNSEDILDEDLRARIGLAGELAVVDACRDQLSDLGHPELAAAVQQVSLVSAAMGYDVFAPRVGASARKMEVKTTTADSGSGLFRFFLSRNEYEQGRRNPTDWSLVACRLNDDQVTILGWAPVRSLTPYLPDDASGRWTEAVVRFPQSGLIAGLPSPT